MLLLSALYLGDAQSAEADLMRISNKVRFILAVVGGQLKISNRRRADIEAELEREGYDKLPNTKKQQQVRAAGYVRALHCGARTV